MDGRGADQNDRQRQGLPAEQGPGRLPQIRVQQQQGDSPFQGPGGTEIFAEQRRDNAGIRHKEGREQDHQQRQHRILQTTGGPVQPPGHRELGNRDFVQQVLHQPEGAQQAADRPAQDHPEEHEGPQHIEGNVMLRPQGRL